MLVLAGVLRIAVAAILFAAAALKARDRTSAAESTAALGVPGRIAGPITAVVGCCEVALAVLLLPGATARFAAAGAALLLLAFTALLAGNLLRGNTPSCSCFGALSDEPISWWSVARNLVFVALAVPPVVVSAQPSITGWLWSLPAAGKLAAVAIVALAALVLLLLEGLRVLTRGEADQEVESIGKYGPPEDTPIPFFELPAHDGELHRFDSFASKRPVLLVFVHPTCASCRETVPGIERFRDTAGAFLEVVLVAHGARGEVEQEFGHTSLPLLIDERPVPLFHELGLVATPSAVLVSVRGKTSSPVATGKPEISHLLTRLAAAAGHEDEADDFVTGLERGSVTPLRHVVDTAGDRVELVDPERRTAVVFVRGDCAHCDVVLDHLWVWERLEGALEQARVVLVLADGDPEPYRARGIGLPLVADRDRRIAKRFHIRANPAALIIGTDGTIDLPPVRGARNVIQRLGLPVEQDRVDRGSLLSRAAR